MVHEAPLPCWAADLTLPAIRMMHKREASSADVDVPDGQPTAEDGVFVVKRSDNSLKAMYHHDLIDGVVDRGVCFADWRAQQPHNRLHYTVDIHAGSCTCPDYTLNRMACKHMFALVEAGCISINALCNITRNPCFVVDHTYMDVTCADDMPTYEVDDIVASDGHNTACRADMSRASALRRGKELIALITSQLHTMSIESIVGVALPTLDEVKARLDPYVPSSSFEAALQAQPASTRAHNPSVPMHTTPMHDPCAKEQPVLGTADALQEFEPVSVAGRPKKVDKRAFPLGIRETEEVVDLVINMSEPGAVTATERRAIRKRKLNQKRGGRKRRKFG